MIKLIIPYQAHVDSLQNEIDYYVKTEQYEKAAAKRDELKDFIAKGVNAEIDCHPISIVDKKNNE